MLVRCTGNGVQNITVPAVGGNGFAVKHGKNAAAVRVPARRQRRAWILMHYHYMVLFTIYAGSAAVPQETRVPGWNCRDDDLAVASQR